MRDYQRLTRVEIEERIDALIEEMDRYDKVGDEKTAQAKAHFGLDRIPFNAQVTEAYTRVGAAADLIVGLQFELDLRDDPAMVEKYGPGID